MKYLFSVLSAILAIVVSQGVLFAQTSDTLATSVTWTQANSPYTITEDVVVAQGVTLTIEPGAEIRFSSGTSMIVDGALVANGTQADQIVFTSDAGSPANGDWGSIRFNNSSSVGSEMSFIIMEYGGGGEAGALITYRTGALGIPVTHSEFRFSAGHGIDLRASSPLIKHSTFRDNNGYGIFSDLALNFEVDSSTVTRNGQGGIRVPINSTPTINATTITENGTGIYIDNGAIPTITYNDILDNNIGIRVIEAGSVTPTISDNTLSGNSVGLQNDGGGEVTADYNFWGDKSGPENFANPSGTGDAVTANVDFTPWLFGATLPVREISTNPADGDIWFADSVYYVQNNISVPLGYTLTIQPGAVVKFVDNVTFTVNGTLIADGTEQDKIYFTSQYDDAIGGDSNEDARNTQPARGNWRQILIEGNSQNTVLDYVDIRFGGSGTQSLYLRSLTVSVTNVLVTNSNHHGIFVDNKPIAFNNITSNSNRYDGIYVQSTGTELNNLTASFNDRDGVVVELYDLTEDVSIDSLMATNNGENGVYFGDGGTGRSFGLTSLTNSTISNNVQNGLLVDENDVDQITINNNTFSGNGEFGASLYLTTAYEENATIFENTFENNGYSGVRTTAAQIYANIFEGNEIGISAWGRLGNSYTDGAGVDGNTFVDNTYNNVVGLEGYFLRGTLSTVFPEAITSGAYMFQRVYSNSGWSPAVSPNDTLQIQPGVLIKAWDGRYSDGAFGTIDGMIIAEGTATDPIVFTSWRDDSVGGNTNAVDDTVSARSNDWGGLYIQDRYNDNDGIAKFSRLSHVHIKYAAYGLDMEMGEQLFAEPLDNIWVSNSYNRGMVLDYGRYTVSNSIIENSQRYDGIYSYYDGDITVRNSTIRNNGAQGLYARGASGSFFREVSNSTIENNEDNGVYAFESPSASTFLGNTIQNNGEHGLNYYSQVLDSTDVFFTGNIFKDNSLSGVVSTASIFVDNIFEGNEFGISLHGKLGHRYTDESGVDGNTFTDNTYNNVVGLEGYFLNGRLSTQFPEAITSGAYMFQRVYSNSGWSPAVSPNDTLQIQPGVLIKAWDGRYSDGSFGTIDGMIIAEGTATDPIVFTSWRDDSVGGNTNAVDDTVSARSNDWGGLYIQDRYNDNDGVAKFSRLSHVHIKYAAYGLDMEMGEQLFAEPLDNIWVSNSYNRGMVLDYGRYTVSNSIVENSQRYDGIYSYYDGDITVRNSTIRNNGAQGLYARGASGSFFREVSNSTIENNEDNGVYAFDGNNPMTFQQNKIKDNGMAGLNVTIFEAGTDTVLTISGNHISNNGEQGILSSRAIIVDDTLIGNKYPIGVTGELSKAGTVNETGNYYEGNIIENNEFNDVVTVSGDIEGVLGGAKPVSFTDNIVYGISNVEVSNTDTLIVNKGTIIKNNSSVTFDIEGHFEALGTATEKIVFTSILDDTYGGNTNGDSTNVLPEINNWSQLYLRGAATDSSEIRNVISRYANYALQLYDSDALVDSSFFSNSRYGVYVTSNATPTLRSSDFHSNYYDGVYVTSGGNPQIQLSNFYNNDRYGLYQAAGTNIIAQNNYWGDATGPFVDQGADQNLQGMGDRIYIQNGTVSYRTFLTGRNGILLGDVTENGGISPFDASKVLLHVVQTELLTGNALAAADVSGNGDVSAMDASFILQYVVGTISGFPGQGKRQSVDYREILALSYEDTEHFTDIRLDHLGGANMYSSEIEMVIPNNHIKEVEFVDSPYGDNISFLYNIEADTIRMAFASSVSLNEEGALGKIRLIYEDDAEGSNTKNLINYKHFSIDEQDITGFVNEITSDIRDDGAVIPESFNLHQNYPNPFNPTTQIAFALPQNGQVQVQVYNMLGQLVQTLVDERKTAGNYNVKWNASQFGSGTYILRIEFKGDDNQRYSQVRKMMLIK